MTYTALEADIRKGQVVPREPDRLPESGRALIVILQPAGGRADWQKARRNLGWLHTDIDPAEWQRKTRAEWDCRR